MSDYHGPACDCDDCLLGRLKRLEPRCPEAESRKVAYICAACGGFAYVVIDSLDSGTTLTCDTCGGLTVVDLDTPEQRAERYARAALASAPGECETCGGSGVFRFGPDCRGNPGGEQECPPCSGTGRSPGETARETVAACLYENDRGDWARLKALLDEPLWADGKHSGDCTQQSHRCYRCAAEEVYADADEILSRLAALAPPSAEAEALNVPKEMDVPLDPDERGF